MTRIMLVQWLTFLLTLSSFSHLRAEHSFDLRAAIAEAENGGEVKIPAGVFKLDKSLTLWKANFTLSGAGKDLTILDFGSVAEGGQGILVRASGVAVDGVTILDPPGDGLVARGVEKLSLRDIRVKWMARAPGGYGVYPVQCRNVIMDDLTVSGAVEAGIYVGQTAGAQIKNSFVHNNVVGIDIENSSFVVVRENTSKNNSIGVAVTGRPFLFLKNPERISVIRNEIADNNLTNFAPESSFVRGLGSGIGLVMTAVRDIVVEDNVIERHVRSAVEMINYELIDPFFEGDSGFDPGFSGAKFRANIFGKLGNSPSLTILDKQTRQLGVVSTVTVSGYNRREVDASFTCFSSLASNTVLLASIDYFLGSTLPCDFDRNIRI